MPDCSWEEALLSGWDRSNPSEFGTAMNLRLSSRLLWFLFFAWLLVQVPFFINLSERGHVPIDYLAYLRAAEAIERDESPYLPAAQSLKIFAFFHQFETDLLAGHAL